MKQALSAGLPTPPQPFSWAVRSRDLMFLTHGPVCADGTILQGTIEAQTELTLQNFAASMAEVGATLEAIVQVQIFLVEVAHMGAVDEVYRRHFKPPYPNRASLVVKGLVAPGMLIEITAIADLAGVGR